MSSVQRLEWLDAVKGIGILLVMFVHTGGLHVPYLALFLLPGYISMFYVVSGVTHKSRALGDMIQRKAKSLLYPYFFYSAIGFLLGVVLPSATPKISFWNGLLGVFYSRYALYELDCPENIFFMNVNAPLWFLTSLFVSECIAFVILNQYRIKRCSKN